MSSAAKGREREHRLMRLLESKGYCTFRSPGSKGIDIFAVHERADLGYPHLAIEVGGIGKRVAVAHAMLAELKVPAGTLRLVVRWLVKPGHRGAWRWHLDPDNAFESFDDLMEAARE